MDVIEGNLAQISIPFSKTPEPVIPDFGSVSYSLFDAAGNSLVIDEPVVTGPTSFQASLSIPATWNSVAISSRFSRRHIQLTYQVSGAVFQTNISYRVIPKLTHSVGPSEVRGFLGVNLWELEDSDIDLTGAYFDVEASVGRQVLEEALISGNILELKANELIRMRAAIQVIPSLRHRVAQEEKNGVKSFQRPTIKSYDDLLAAAQKRYDEALGVLVDQSGSEQYILIVVTQDTDPITGGQ